MNSTNRIMKSNISQVNLYEDIEPLQENLLDPEEIQYYNCGINTEQGIIDNNQAIEHHVNRQDVIAENPRIIELDQKIENLDKKEKAIEDKLSCITLAKQIVNVTGNVGGLILVTFEGYSLVLQNMKSAPSINFPEFFAFCGAVTATAIVTKTLKYVFSHFQEKLAKESRILGEEIIKLEVKRNNL